MTLETPIEKARRCWGEKLPDWVAGLAQQCMARSQNQVAKQMGYSASLVSAVIAARYPGDLSRVEDIYRGVFEAKTVDCPVLGTLSTERCRHWRARSGRLIPTNSLNVSMFRACRACPLNATGGQDD